VTPPATPTATDLPWVSVLVCSYNYERFVGQTISSALAQTWPRTEVGVVDDGSTDGSWAVIESFGSKVKAIRRANGGQGAAYNTCLAASRGDWVIWLDCDDLLDPDCIARCMEHVVADDVHKVAFPMRVVDAEGRPTGYTIPYTMHAGHVGPTLRRFGTYGGPPGSGNLYRRTTLEPYFPLDEREWAMCADTVPFVVAAALGRVAASAEPLGCYRIHRKANVALGLFGNQLGTLIDTLVLDDRRRAAAMALVRPVLPGAAQPLAATPTQVRTRVISWRVARATHPYAGDSARALMAMAWQGLRAWPGYRALDRAVQLAWTAAVLWLPLSLAQRVIRLNASNEAKMRVRAIALR
jgi:hypothetical protein